MRLQRSTLKNNHIDGLKEVLCSQEAYFNLVIIISNKNVSQLDICIKVSCEIILALLSLAPALLPLSVWWSSQHLSSVLCPMSIFSRASVHTFRY